MGPPAVPSETAGAGDLGAAAEAAVDRPLAGDVAADGVIVAHRRGRAELGHRRAPSEAVARTVSATVAVEGEEVGVLVHQRRDDALGRVEDAGGQEDLPTPEVGASCRGRPRPPVKRRTAP